MNGEKYVKIKGGLGNQLFQYAFGRMLEERYGFTVKYDLHQYRQKFNEINNYKLDKFNTKVLEATSQELKRICKISLEGNPHTKSYRIRVAANKMLNFTNYYFEKNRLLHDIDLIKSYKYFDGYWQSPEYFRDIREQLLQELTLKSVSMLTKATIHTMQTENAVFIGVRRPYSFESKQMKTTLNDVSSSFEYYDHAVEYIKKRVENPVFYVFSNDIDWVKSNMHIDGNVVYRTKECQTSDEEELVIMSSCKHAILSNSTFNWWGAWLIPQRDKLVLVPKHWQRNSNCIIPNEWINYDQLMNDI